MKVNNVSMTNFAGKYRINANQILENDSDCLRRDALIGFWTTKARNGENIHKRLIDFYKGDYEQNREKALNVTFDLPSKLDKDFEESMNSIGQSYNRLA